METIRVLVVSDEPTDVLHIETLLAKAPNPDTTYTVESVSTYQNAIRALVSNTHDLFLIDYRVPGTHVTGIELIQRAYAGGCTAPIILLTQLDDETMRWAAESVGAADVIHKRADLCPHPDCPLQRNDETPRRLLDRAIRYAVRNVQRLRNVQTQVDGMQRQLIDLNRKLSRG